MCIRDSVVVVVVVVVVIVVAVVLTRTHRRNLVVTGQAPVTVDWNYRRCPSGLEV